MLAFGGSTLYLLSPQPEGIISIGASYRKADMQDTRLQHETLTFWHAGKAQCFELEKYFSFGQVTGSGRLRDDTTVLTGSDSERREMYWFLLAQKLRNRFISTALIR